MSMNKDINTAFEKKKIVSEEYEDTKIEDAKRRLYAFYTFIFIGYK